TLAVASCLANPRWAFKALPNSAAGAAVCPANSTVRLCTSEAGTGCNGGQEGDLSKPWCPKFEYWTIFFTGLFN
ncbi:hypothetical protein NDU88_001532, partial [Pleurodeles waltl]